MPTKPVPKALPETQPYWDATARHELQIQRCTSCSTPFFYPRTTCPSCGSTEVEWFTASGNATLYSYVINHRPAPGWQDEAPYAIAVVQLEEGPRLMTSIVGIEPTPENLELDMALSVDFEERGDMTLPVFRPAVGK